MSLYNIAYAHETKPTTEETAVETIPQIRTKEDCEPHISTPLFLLKFPSKMVS